MRHVPGAGALWRLPFAGSGRLVAMAKGRMPVPQHGVVLLGGSQAPPALARRSFAWRRVLRGAAARNVLVDRPLRREAAGRRYLIFTFLAQIFRP